jgi:nicotinamidase-related amidase
MDIKELVIPWQTAVLVIECQEGVIGKYAPENLRQLADAARNSPLITRLPGLLDSARNAGIPVFYCIYEQRPDGLAISYNTPLMAALGKAGPRMVRGTPEARIIPELTPHPQDFIVSRIHGMTPFYGTELDSLLRNLGIRTVIVTGVSLNVAIIGTAIEAGNRGYFVVLPADCVAGFPPEYCEAMLQYSLRSLAYITTSDKLLTALSKL